MSQGDSSHSSSSLTNLAYIFMSLLSYPLQIKIGLYKESMLIQFSPNTKPKPDLSPASFESPHEVEAFANDTHVRPMKKVSVP